MPNSQTKYLTFCLLLLISMICLSQINCSALDDVAKKIVAGISKIQYSLHSSDSHKTMDCLKISYDYDIGVFGIYHAGNSQTHYSELYYAELDNATGLWKNSVKLSDRGSQGTITRVYDNGKARGFLIGYELENSGGNKIAIRYYENQQKLRINNFLYQYQLVTTVSDKHMRNVGTPSLEEIQLLKEQSDPKFNEYFVNVKFHYCPDGAHDFPGYGYVYLRPLRDFVDKTGKWIGGCFENYQDWKGMVDITAQGVLRQAGCSGKIGQRDYFYLGSQKYYLYECNINPSFDWYSWRIALYSPNLKQAKFLGLVLGGDIDIANPHISLVSRSSTSYEFTMTFFLPGEGIKPEIQAKGGECAVTTRFSYP